MAKPSDWLHYIMRGRDPTTAAVLAEDLGAVAGLGIACEPGAALRCAVPRHVALRRAHCACCACCAPAACCGVCSACTVGRPQ